MEKEEYINMVNNAIQGDLHSFEKLILLHAKMLERYIACRIANTMESEDLFQEVLLIAWLNMSQLKQAAAFKRWLYQIANNCCKHWYAKQDRTPISAEDEELEQVIHHRQYEHSNYSTTQQEINTAIECLPEKQRQVILDFYFNHLKIKEIALIRGVPEGTVKRRLHDSRRNLKKKMENTDETFYE